MKEILNNENGCYCNANIQPLDDFAYLGDIDQKLGHLAIMAKPEAWGFTYSKNTYHELPILWGHLKITFQRLQFQNKIVYSTDGDSAVFNTGLYSKYNDPILGFFLKNKPGKKSKWKLKHFKTLDIFGQEEISEVFCAQIQPATYAVSQTEMVYNIDYGTPQVNIDDVLLPSIHRYPYELFMCYGIGNFDSHDFSALSAKEKRKQFVAIRNIILSNSNHYNSMVRVMEEAIDRSMRWLKVDYKVAVPIYYPIENCLCLALPLCFFHTGEPDLALLVRQTPKKEYKAVTILPLDLAYIDARAIAPVNSTWLDVDIINKKYNHD